MNDYHIYCGFLLLFLLTVTLSWRRGFNKGLKKGRSERVVRQPSIEFLPYRANVKRKVNGARLGFRQRFLS